jgi:hypothetical protein
MGQHPKMIIKKIDLKEVCYLFVMEKPELDPFPRWTARGTNAMPLVLRRPKLIEEGVECKVFILETAETRSSMAAFSTSFIPEASSLWDSFFAFRLNPLFLWRQRLIEKTQMMSGIYACRPDATAYFCGFWISNRNLPLSIIQYDKDIRTMLKRLSPKREISYFNTTITC